MDSLPEQPHFVLFPFMAQGHLLPTVDIGRLLAQRGVIVTIVTTPHNAGGVQKSIARSIESGHPICLVQLWFPDKEVGFPEGVENLDLVHSMDDFSKFFIAANKMEEAMEKLFEKLTPRPNCIVSDMCLYYTHKIATRFKVPRIYFNGFCCFCLLCSYNIHSSKILETIPSDSEYFTVPGLTQKVEFTKAQLPFQGQGDESWKEIIVPIIEAGQASYGVVINTFEELESAFIKEYKKVKKAWCIGPVSLSHKDEWDKAERGNKASINEQQCLKWLDSQESGSVIYACLGSISTVKCPELIELGLGLEASNKPFIWVLRGNNTTLNEVEKWMEEDGFEERTKGRGLVVKGWAPQASPLITLPLLADQFSNEKLAVQVLKIGVSLGIEKPTNIGDEKSGFLLKKEEVQNAIHQLMDDGNEGMERRRRAKEFGEKAKKAVEVGGSSYLEMTLLIQDAIHQSQNMCSN
ncbi:hypothetical protein V6N13_006289 [Hibiscus sabdariffa]|uniref:Glycosyltransferase n=1 Tax=Hibiscus sabdariffa TaxID=183260 RepID=A0ABR2EQT0_9ROSI